MMIRKGKEFYKRIRSRYHLTILDKNNFTEVYSTTITRLKAGIVFLSASSGIIFFTIMLVFFTPIKHLIPGYPTSASQKVQIRNVQIIDSLITEIESRDRFLQQIKAVIKGEIPYSEVVESKMEVSATRPKLPTLQSKDTLFAELISSTTDNNGKSSKSEDNLSSIKFTKPVKGLVVNKFLASPDHFGIDIVGNQKTQISAALDGTVFFSDWTQKTGFVIAIQHQNNLITIYKHNSELLKKVGDIVKAGDFISTMGNSGELTTGPHLHFELWQKGKPINPELYLKF